MRGMADYYVRIPGDLNADELQSLSDAGIEDRGNIGSSAGWVGPGSDLGKEWENSRVVKVNATDDEDACSRVAAALGRRPEDVKVIHPAS